MTHAGNGKSTGGRPKIELSDEDIALVGLLAGKLAVGDIAHILGFSESTLFRRFNEDEQVLTAYQRGRAAAKSAVAETLYCRAVAGDMTAAIFYLKTQAGWKETQVVEGTHEHRHRGEEAADEFVSRVRRLASTN